MNREQKLVSFVTAAVIIIGCFLFSFFGKQSDDRILKVGFIYVGDGATAYTKNFMNAQENIAETFGDKVTCIAKYNVTEGAEEVYIQELVDEGCEIIFGTSYGYGPAMVEAAKKNPHVQFCHATGDLTQDGSAPSNYHTYMGHVYEGRYITGVVSGMKLKELIEEGKIASDEAVVGYVAAFPYAEVISGYTSFFLGVRSVCPTATMKVKYTNTWSGYAIEKQYAEELIDEGCVIISQHSDTTGPAVACENAAKTKTVYHIAYNQSMINVAPTTSITGCRVNWSVYETAAVEAVYNRKDIESVLGGRVCVNGNDAGAGFSEGWVEMLEINDVIAPKGTRTTIDTCIDGFTKKYIHVFSGNYTGVNPFDPSDTIDLSTTFQENSKASAPSFHYVLDDVITIE